MIKICADKACKPLRDFLDKCTTHLSSGFSAAGGAGSGNGNGSGSGTSADGNGGVSGSDLALQPFATPDKVVLAHDAFKSGAMEAYVEWTEALRGYLMDEETVAVLMPPAQVSG